MNYKSNILLTYNIRDEFFYYGDKLVKYIDKFLSTSFFSNNTTFNNNYHHRKCSYYFHNTE